VHLAQNQPVVRQPASQGFIRERFNKINNACDQDQDDWSDQVFLIWCPGWVAIAVRHALIKDNLRRSVRRHYDQNQAQVKNTVAVIVWVVRVGVGPVAEDPGADSSNRDNRSGPARRRSRSSRRAQTAKLTKLATKVQQELGDVTGVVNFLLAEILEGP